MGVSVEIYENVRLAKIRLNCRAMETLRIIGRGRGAVVTVSRDMLEETGALMEESEGLAQELRSISGVEYSAVLKEYGPKSVRVSLRAKKRRETFSKIAARLGGGAISKPPDVL